ncbi:hypothetical protein [Palleronia rufa]|uniref:hypothetical protein n=1 Tax=Palleronia rufa TaxID=1530186 RepID=UPI0013789602|nr:hypothetical protein [Palleronia rufa]
MPSVFLPALRKRWTLPPAARWPATADPLSVWKGAPIGPFRTDPAAHQVQPVRPGRIFGQRFQDANHGRPPFAFGVAARKASCASSSRVPEMETRGVQLTPQESKALALGEAGELDNLGNTSNGSQPVCRYVQAPEP